MDLSNNQLERIEGLDDLPIQELYLQNNNITSLHGLAKLPYLSTLDLSHNLITDLAPLQYLSQLTVIILTDNKIECLDQLEYMKNIEWLRTAQLDYNPLCLLPGYRLV